MHHPREIVRVERDYTGGEICQFSAAYPLELEGRVSALCFYLYVIGLFERGCWIYLSYASHLHSHRVHEGS